MATRLVREKRLFMWQREANKIACWRTLKEAASRTICPGAKRRRSAATGCAGAFDVESKGIARIGFLHSSHLHWLYCRTVPMPWTKGGARWSLAAATMAAGVHDR